MNDYYKLIIISLKIYFLLKVNIYNYSINSMNNNIFKKRIIGDVLFINGCDPNFLPQSYRYRILHQIEQFKAGCLDTYEIYYLNLNPLMVSDFRVIILYRCPWTDNIGNAITYAKSLNKKVLFDIDDLVIDTKYTDLVPYIQSLTKSQKILYDEGVVRMRKTLQLCEGAITTTEILFKELKNYVSEVFINRNVASEMMFKLSDIALKKKKNKKLSNKITIGYFSGSITHNDDINMITPALIKILKEFKNVILLIVGEININKDLKKLYYKIKKKKSVKWNRLPQLISQVDINIAPLKDNIFNEAKSENKWLEASLVKVPTIASNIGAFKQIIKNGETGILCNTIEDWYIELKNLINDKNLQKTIAENAFEVCKENYNTINTGRIISNHINTILNKHIGFVLPSLEISGGVKVVLIHASYLQDEGWDVDLIIPDNKIKLFDFNGHQFNVISLNNVNLNAQYDILVATLYTTLNIVLHYTKVKRRLYLVQSYETEFFSYGDNLRNEAEKTYTIPFDIEYITISKWCYNWLLEKYNKKSKYSPNGIYPNEFLAHKRNLTKAKIRILIEGDNSSKFKNVDESFQIVDKLERNKFEIWYMSYNAKPKSWYKYDKFFNKVPYEKVNEIYEKCDILIKSSILDSFSYPPLEMMATGGYCILTPTKGNIEYLKNEQNCLFYKLGNIEDALNCIERLISNETLQQHLYENGLLTVKKRDWKNFKKNILNLYE